VHRPDILCAEAKTSDNGRQRVLAAVLLSADFRARRVSGRGS
jgi:hypothetical protein